MRDRDETRECRSERGGSGAVAVVASRAWGGSRNREFETPMFMKTLFSQSVLRLTGIACCVLAVATARGQVFQDDFSGAAIDPLRWQILLPFADSSVTASNGFA